MNSDENSVSFYQCDITMQSFVKRLLPLWKWFALAPVLLAREVPDPKPVPTPFWCA
jgi:hypothetical protein